jgi:hypothetical protein
MIVRELPWKSGRFFEIDSCNAILQPESKFTYFILKCHCHATPESHVAEIADVFFVKNYNTIAPFTPEWLHVIESNPSGKIYFEGLKRSMPNTQSCVASKF